MTNKDIYDSALKILGETANDGSCDDYEERAPYLIAVFCSESWHADRLYRSRNSLPVPEGDASRVYLPLTEIFPCADRFASAAALYLASMLVLDEDGALADKLFARYSDAMSAVCASLPANIEPISDKYFF